jgi:hypothetical protein
MNDNIVRAAASALGVGLYGLLIEYTKAKLRARRDKVGCGLPEEFGRWLGKSWARTRRAYQRTLQR